MIALVSYASEKMYLSQEKLVVSSLKYGVEKTFTYSKRDIDDLFYKMNQKTLEQERGAGYWLWKPYVINKALHSGYLHEGDILIYSDAGVEIVEDVKCLIDRMDEDILFFTNGFPHVEWCKGNVYNTLLKHMNLDESYKQVQASVIVMKVTDKVKQFMSFWLAACQFPGWIDDSPGIGNYETFAEHRHDQAILTCLQIAYGYKLHWWPTRYSDHLPRTDAYPVMFNHHRKRNNEW
jgi:hypothetical protein